jgi:hypothetical protein
MGTPELESFGLPVSADEMEETAYLFNKVVALCFKKCVQRLRDTELTVGETSCVDRCAYKFFHVHREITFKTSAIKGVSSPHTL